MPEWLLSVISGILAGGTSLCFVVLVLLLFCVFFVLFALLVVWFSMGPLTGLCIGPLPVLC